MLIQFILNKPQLSENVGMSLRSIGCFGFENLSLVSPRKIWPNDKGIKSAKHFSSPSFLAFTNKKTSGVFCVTRRAPGKRVHRGMVLRLQWKIDQYGRRTARSHTGHAHHTGPSQVPRYTTQYHPGRGRVRPAPVLLRPRPPVGGL